MLERRWKLEYDNIPNQNQLSIRCEHFLKSKNILINVRKIKSTLEHFAETKLDSNHWG